MLDPLRILSLAAASSGVRGGIEGSPGGHSLLRSPRQVKGMETQRQEQRWAGTVTRSCVCVCVCIHPQAHNRSHPCLCMSMLLSFSVFWVFSFCFPPSPVCNLSHFHLFSFLWQTRFCPLLFSFSSLSVSVSVSISVFSSPASPSAILPCIAQYLFLCLSS